MRHLLFAVPLGALIFTAFSAYSQNKPDTLIVLREFEVSDLIGQKVFQSADTIGQMTISQMPAKDIGDMLRSQPNVSGIRKGGTGIDPVVRGFKFSQLNVQLNEGHKIEGACPNRMDPPTAHVDVDDITTIEIFKGPYALRFGPNFGGMIHMHTWPEEQFDKFQVKVKALTGFESSWIGLKEKLDLTLGDRHFLVRLSGNYKKYGDYKDGNGNTVGSSFERYNYGGMVRVIPAKNHSINAAYEQSIGKNLDFPTLPMDERLDKTNLYSVDYIYYNKGRVIRGIHGKFYYSDVNHEMDNKQRPVSDTTVAISTIHAINMGYRAEISLAVAKGILHAGVDMEDIQKDGDRVKYMIMQPSMPVKTEKLWDNAYIGNNGLFAEYSRLVGKFTVVGAARLDLNRATSNPLTWENMQGQRVYSQDEVESNYLNFSFSAGVDYFLSRKVMLRLSLGRGVRSPDMTERFILLLPIGYDNYDYLGNPALKPEVNHQADAMIKWTGTKSGVIKAGIFYSYVTNYISGRLLPESVVKPQTKGVYGVKQFENLENAWLTGFELEYNTPLDNPWLIELNAAYTFGTNPLASHYITENGEVTGVEEIKNDPLPEIPPLEGMVGFSWKFYQERLIPRITLRAVAPQNRTSVAYDERSSPGFVLTGLSLLYQFNQALRVIAGIDNLFDVAYYEHLNRTIVGTHENYYEPGINFYITLKFTP
jgi:iron complex outermembrane receptor protein